MVKEELLVPKYYVHKIAICDNCNVELIDSKVQLLSSPPLKVMKCPKCNKDYNISVNELQDEWRWK